MPRQFKHNNTSTKNPVNEELRDLYSSPNIIRQIKSRIMRWAGHVVRVGEERKVYRMLVGKPERKETTWKIKA
jgi:hypothetical protein